MLRRKLKNTVNEIRRRKKKVKGEHSSSNYIILGITFLVLVVILSLILPIFLSLYRFEPTTVSNPIAVSKWDQNEKFKVLLVGIDRKSEQHIFVDALLLLVLDPSNNEVGLININPDIVTYNQNIDKQMALRRSLIDSNDEGFEEVASLTESVLATEIDRVMVIEPTFLKEMDAYTNNIPVTLLREVSDNDVVNTNNSSSWPIGKVNVSAEAVYDFVRSDSNGRDDQLTRQLEIYKNYIQNIDKLKLLLGFSDFLDIIEKNLLTNMTKIEMIRTYLFLRSVPPGSYKTVYTRSDILTHIGKEGVYDTYKVDEEQLDNDNEVVLESRKVLLEQPVVEVLNASGEPGVAREKARWLDNMGAELVHIANAPFLEDKTIVYIENKGKYENTVKEFKKVLGEETEFLDMAYQYRHIGNIVVVVGKDY